MTTTTAGGFSEIPKVTENTAMPRQRYYGEDRRAPGPKPVTRIQSFLQSIITVGAVIAVGLSIHQAGKTDENRLTKLENNETRAIQIMEEQTKTNKMLTEGRKSDAEDKILMLDRLIKIEKDREKREELKEALKRAKAIRLQGKVKIPEKAKLGMLRGIIQ